jgi:hypothetical protein
MASENEKRRIQSMTLEELDPTALYDASVDDSDTHLIQRANSLLKKPLCLYSPGDLRLMILQGISLDFLIPVAIDILREAPLSEGEYYPGDVLHAVLCAPTSYWRLHGSEKEDITRILDSLSAVPPELSEAVRLFRMQRTREP